MATSRKKAPHHSRASRYPNRCQRTPRHFLRVRTFKASRLWRRATGPVGLCRTNSTLSFGIESSPALFVHELALSSSGPHPNGLCAAPLCAKSLGTRQDDSALATGVFRSDATALFFCDCEVARRSIREDALSVPLSGLQVPDVEVQFSRRLFQVTLAALCPVTGST